MMTQPQPQPQPEIDWRDYQRPYPENNPVLNRVRELVQSQSGGIAPADAIRQAEKEMGVSRLDYFPHQKIHERPTD